MTSSWRPSSARRWRFLKAEQPIDLLLVDIVMPDSVNGIALSRMARLRRRELKVIYLTGYSIPGVEREALGPILRKPVDNQVLIEEIATGARRLAAYSGAARPRRADDRVSS